MSIRSDKETKSILPKQNRYLLIILWLLLLFLLDIGWVCLTFIDNSYKEKKRIDDAKHEVEALSSRADFPLILKNTSRNFNEILISGVQSLADNLDNLTNFIKQRADSLFRRPFPKYELYVFQIPSNKVFLTDKNLLYSNVDRTIIKKNSSVNGLCKSFEYLAKVNIDKEKNREGNKEGNKEENKEEKLFKDTPYGKQEGAITKKLLGGEVDPDIIAEFERSKCSLSYYKNNCHYFYWDYFVNEKNGVIYGFYIFVEKNKTTNIEAKLLALKSFRGSKYNEEIRHYAAFIPLFPGSGGVIAEEEFTRLPEYKEKKRKWVPENINDLYKWYSKGVPKNTKDIRIGNYQAFFHLSKDETHVATLLVPIAEKINIPYWLSIINIIVLVVLIIYFIRGFKYGIWPQTSLRVRFVTAYFLAACLPLGLLSIASYAYISQYRHSQLFNSISRLKLCIKEFDNRKAQRQDEYRTAFVKLKNDNDLLGSFEKLNKANSKENALDIAYGRLALDIKNKHLKLEEEKLALENAKEKLLHDFPGAKETLDKCLAFYASGTLPILAITIIDERGNCLINIGNKDCSYFRPNGETDYQKKLNTKSYEGEELEKRNEDNFLVYTTLRILSYPLLQSLRTRISTADTEKVKWDEKDENDDGLDISQAAMGAFKTAFGSNMGNLAEEMDRRRSIASTRLVENRIIGTIHDYILVNKVPRFIVLVFWDVNDLDKETFISSLHYFKDKANDFVFEAYSPNSQTSKLELDTRFSEQDRHFRGFVENEIKRSKAEEAQSKNSVVTHTAPDDSFSLIAAPSEKYFNKIIVGGVSHKPLELDILKRKVFLIVIIILSLLIFIVCIYFSSKIFLKPIGNLKDSLDLVAEGNLNIEIESKRKDEFGTMCHEFSEMTHELLERDKLATLLSDHAVEALSQNSDAKVISEVESFVGTALVTDIRNFTGMCEKYAPDLITDLLNEHFAVMTRVISKNGGRIYKYIGDAIEVIFADRDDSVKSSTERAFWASIEMIECLKEINKKRLGRDLFEYKIGIGLCYGKMVSGSIGNIETRLDYAIIGNALKLAAKLESVSKLNPDLPIIVSDEFVSDFKNQNSEIKFLPIKNNDNLKAFIIDSQTLENNRLVTKEAIEKDEIINNFETSNKTENTSNGLTKHIEVEENFSFWIKFFPGFVFILLLIFVLLLGCYFTHTAFIDTKKTVFISDNQREFEQFISQAHGRAAFDIKCRDFSKKLYKVIENLSPDKITDSLLSRTLNEIYLSDKIYKEVGMKKIFIKVGDYSGLKNAKDTSFVDNLPIKAVSNTGFSTDEAKKLCDSFRISLSLNELDNFAQKEQKIKGGTKDEYQATIKEYLRDNYKEPLREVFGERALISLLQKDMLNSSLEGSYQGESCLLFLLDYHIVHKGKSKLIGYLVLSMSTQTAFDSVSFALSAFSSNGGIIALNETNSGDWYFSDNTPIYLKDSLSRVNQNGKENKDEKIKQIFKNFGFGNEILLFNPKFIINDKTYDFYMTRFYGQENKIYIIAFVFIFLLAIFITYEFIKIINGKSRINTSIAAKLWLALLIVAVIPVFTMISVFNLFINENYFVEEYLKRAEMQDFIREYEQKIYFSTPIIWNYINKKNIDDELVQSVKILNNKNNSENIRKDELKNLRGMTNKWIREVENFSNNDKSFFNATIADMAIAGKTGWTFCHTDKEEEDSIEEKVLVESDLINKLEKNEEFSSVSYIEASNKTSNREFGKFLRILSKIPLKRRGLISSKGDVFNKEDTLRDEALRMGLHMVRTFFGRDKEVEIANSLDVPITLDAGIGRLGVINSYVPNSENAEAVIVWMVVFKTFTYLIEETKSIYSDFNLYLSEIYRYGILADKDTKDNNIRIPLGKFAANIATSNTPVSTSVKMNGESYLVEGMLAKSHLNAFLLFTCPESVIHKMINKISFAFYLILVVFMIIVINTTKNIAEDIINPINALIMGIKEVNRENFSFRINTDRTDELGSLCLSFDKMIKGLDEKRTMSHMVSKTAQMVALHGSGKTSIKTDSVLAYISIPNFATYMNELNDYELMNSLRKQTAIITDLIMNENGEVDKIMGEKLLCVFSVEDNPQGAAHAACRVAKRILYLSQHNKLPFPVDIGLNYGSVIVGFLGVGSKRDFTVIGDAVNVTARIESLAEKTDTNKCLISEYFYNLISDSINANVFGEVELKGKSQPMKVYQIS